jgi:DNA-binding NarL/FixJ family response regulator
MPTRISQAHLETSEISDTSDLTSRQKQLIRLLSDGLSRKEIAASLNLSIKTVDMHIGRLMVKLELHSTADVVHYAIGTGLAPLRRRGSS